MDPFKLLKADHQTVSELFDTVEAARGQAKSAAFRKLKTELDVHAHIEETFLYPALKNAEASRDITLEAYEEHKVVKDLLAELAAENPATSGTRNSLCLGKTSITTWRKKKANCSIRLRTF